MSLRYAYEYRGGLAQSFGSRGVGAVALTCGSFWVDSDAVSGADAYLSVGYPMKGEEWSRTQASQRHSCIAKSLAYPFCQASIGLGSHCVVD